jgi:hypothetical protein
MLDNGSQIKASQQKLLNAKLLLSVMGLCWITLSTTLQVHARGNHNLWLSGGSSSLSLLPCARLQQKQWLAPDLRIKSMHCGAAALHRCTSLTWCKTIVPVSQLVQQAWMSKHCTQHIAATFHYVLSQALTKTFLHILLGGLKLLRSCMMQAQDRSDRSWYTHGSKFDSEWPCPGFIPCSTAMKTAPA